MTNLDALRRGALRCQGLTRFLCQPVGQCMQPGHLVCNERHLDSLLAHDCLVGKPHAVGRKYSCVRVDEDGLHAEFVRNQAGVLATGAAEALQREAGGVVALLHRNLLDRVRHVADRDPQEALADGPRVPSFAGGAPDLFGKSGKFLYDHRGIERLVRRRSEDRREMRRLDLADADIGICHRQRATATVGGRPGIGAGGTGANAEASAIEMQDRTAARGNGVDRHYRRANAHPSYLGFEGPLELTGV